MSQSEAADAVFARLSYHATLQAEQFANRIASKLSIAQTAQLALTFCLLVSFLLWIPSCKNYNHNQRGFLMDSGLRPTIPINWPFPILRRGSSMFSHHLLVYSPFFWQQYSHQWQLTSSRFPNLWEFCSVLAEW